MIFQMTPAVLLTANVSFKDKTKASKNVAAVDTVNT